MFVEVDSFLENSPGKGKECSLKPPHSLGQGCGPVRTVYSAAQLMPAAQSSRKMVMPACSLSI